MNQQTIEINPASQMMLPVAGELPDLINSSQKFSGLICKLDHPSTTRLIIGFKKATSSMPFFSIHLHDNGNSFVVKLVNENGELTPSISFQQGNGFRRLNYLNFQERNRFHFLSYRVAGIGSVPENDPVSLLLWDRKSKSLHELGTTPSEWIFNDPSAGVETIKQLAKDGNDWVSDVNKVIGSFQPPMNLNPAIVTKVQRGDNTVTLSTQWTQNSKLIETSTIIRRDNDGKLMVKNAGPENLTLEGDCLFYCYADFGISPLSTKESAVPVSDRWARSALSSYVGPKGNKLYIPISLFLTSTGKSPFLLGTTGSPYATALSPDQSSTLSAEAINACGDLSDSKPKKVYLDLRETA